LSFLRMSFLSAICMQFRKIFEVRTQNQEASYACVLKY
jgi:hypothetical protein